MHLAAMDRAGVERLCGYVLRPPLALPRVERLQGVGGRTMVRIEMKRTYSANAALRAEVIPEVPTSTDAEQAAREARALKRRDGPTPSLRAQLALSWADLLQRVFGRPVPPWGTARRRS